MLFIIISYILYIAAKVLLFEHIRKCTIGIISFSCKYPIVSVRKSYYNSRGNSIESPLPAMSL